MESILKIVKSYQLEHMGKCVLLKNSENFFRSIFSRVIVLVSVTLILLTFADVTVGWSASYSIAPMTQMNGYTGISETSVFDAHESASEPENSSEYFSVQPAEVESFVVAQASMPRLALQSSSRVNETTGSYSVRYSLTGAPNSAVTFKYSLEDVTATKGSDYTEAAESDRMITIPYGGPYFGDNFTIQIMNDSKFEGNETFLLKITEINGAISPSGTDSITQTITIIDDEGPTIDFANTPINVFENVEGGKKEIALELSGPSDSAITVYYFANGRTNVAIGGNDYNPVNSLLTFQPGQTRKTFDIELVNDNDIEIDERATINLSRFSGQAIFASGRPTHYSHMTIYDDDTPTIDITADSFLIGEDSGPFRGKVTVTGTTTHRFLVSLGKRVGSEITHIRRDEYPFSGSNEYSFAIPITNDAMSEEEDETFELVLYDLSRVGNLPINRIVVFPNPENRSGFLAKHSRTVTIVDDDSKTLSISNTDFSVSETTGSATGNNFLLNLDLSSTSLLDVTFDYELINDTATKTADFTDPSSLSGTIAAGESGATISIPIISDSVHENTESFTIRLKNLKGAKFPLAASTLTKTITITDDDEPTLVIPETSTPFLFAEDTPSDQLTLDLSFSKALVLPIDVTIETSSGTAMAGQDFTAMSGATGAISSTTDKLSIPISFRDDALVEEDESFTFRITGLSGAKFPDGVTEYTGTITIVDDESTTLSVKNTRLSVREDVGGVDGAVGVGGFVLIVGLSEATTVDVSVEFDMDTVDTQRGHDFLIPEENERKFDIPAGQTIGTTTIQIKDDDEKEGSEFFEMTLKNVIGAVLASGSDTQDLIITIIDDEYPTVHLPRTGLRVNEGSSEIEVNVELEGASTRLISVSYETVDNTAVMGEDYTYKQGVLNFLPGTLKLKFKIPILDDMTPEDPEWFNINFAITIGDTFFHGTTSTTGVDSVIINDDEPTTLSITNTKFYVSEDIGSDGYKLEATLSKNIRVSYNFAVIGGTAVAGIDYSVISGQKNHPGYTSGQDLTQTIPITIENNDKIDGNRTIRIALTDISGAVFAGGGNSITRTIIIVDDDQTNFSLSTTNFQVDEDVSEGKIDVNYTLTPASLFDVTFKVSTENDTAIKDQDYTEVDQTITIEAGNTTGTFSIPILQDNDPEGEHSFKFKIKDVIGAKIAENAEEIIQTVTIVDDEKATVLLDDILNSGKIVEGYGAYEMNLTISSTTSSQISIAYSSSAGTAVSGTHYTAPANATITNSSGTNTISLSGFNIPANTTNGNKTFTITLMISSGSEAVFVGGMTRKVITMTIIDDGVLRLTPSIAPSSALDQFVDEDIGNVIVNYSLSFAISSDISFDVELSDANLNAQVNATKGVDYIDVENQTITIPAGETSGSFLIKIVDDTFMEPAEQFKIILSNLTHGTFPINQPESWSQVIQINQSDYPTLSITNESYSVIENEGTFDLKIMLSHASTNEVGFFVEYLNESTDTAIDGTHYLQDSTRKFIPTGETSKVIPISIIDVAGEGGNKSFTFTFRIEDNSLGTANYPADAQLVNEEMRIVKTVTIIDNDPVGVQITNNDSDFTLSENGNDLVVNYILGGRLSNDVTFKYDMEDVTTTKVSDYEYDEDETNRTVTISSGGNLQGSFTIPIVDDSDNEGNETFTLVLSELQGASVFVGSGLKFTKTVTIVDNELPTLKFAETELNVIENIEFGILDLNLELTGQTSQDVIFDYNLRDIPSSSDSAIAGTDYTQPLIRSHRIPIGETAATISIPITDDSTAEGNERFNIELIISSGAKFVGGGTTMTQTITIHDNDPPTLSFQTTSISAVENVNSANLDVTVNLNTSTYQDVSFDFALTDGTAKKGIDYLEETTRNVTISAGDY